MDCPVGIRVSKVLGRCGWLMRVEVHAIFNTIEARVALGHDLRTLKASATPGRPVGPARRPVLIMNPKSGGGKVEIVAPRELPAEFPIRELVTPRLVTVKAADGLEIPCQLFMPHGAKAGDRRPAVVVVGDRKLIDEQLKPYTPTGQP